MAGKNLVDFSYDNLDRIEKDRSEFDEGKTDASTARVKVSFGNVACRGVHTAIKAEEHNMRKADRALQAAAA